MLRASAPSWHRSRADSPLRAMTLVLTLTPALALALALALTLASTLAPNPDQALPQP